MFDDRIKAIRALPKLLINKTLEVVKDNESRVVSDITDGQLFTFGQDGKGISLGSYAQSTINRKKAKGQPTNRVTLRDTGEYHRSHRLELTSDGIEVKADPVNGDYELRSRYGDDILVWSDKNQDVFVEKILKESLIKYLKDVL